LGPTGEVGCSCPSDVRHPCESHWIFLSVQVYECVLVTPGCLYSVSVCVSRCLFMCFCQFCFPVLTSDFLWCENFLLSYVPSVWRPKSFWLCQATQRREKQASKQTNTQIPFACSTRKAGLLAPFVAWLLCGGGEELGLSSRIFKWNVHMGGGNNSLR